MSTDQVRAIGPVAKLDGRARSRNPANARKQQLCQPAASIRRAKALELRRAGVGYRQIAAALDTSVGTAWADVQAELADLKSLASEAAEDLRELERLRLDRLLLAAMSLVEDKTVHPNLRVKAILAAVRVGERRARLEGLDAPTRLEHGGGVEVNRSHSVDLGNLTTEELLQYRRFITAVESRREAAGPHAAVPA
jgi:hypothetical protein